MKKISNLFTPLSISLLSIVTLFISLLYISNHNLMIITMSSDSTKLKPQLYFTTQGKPFNEEKSNEPFKIDNGNYYFHLPKFSDIQYLRFDPTNSIDSLSISKITIIRDKWFKIRHYDIPIKNVLPNHHISSLKTLNNRVIIDSNGTDPQLNIHFNYKEVSVSTNYHFNLIILSTLIFIIFKYLYSIHFNISLSKNTYLIVFLGFLFILGTHLLDYYPWIFILISFFLVRWKKIKRWETVFVILFLLSTYITWYALDIKIITNYQLIGQGILIFMMYLVGVSFQLTPTKYTAKNMEKYIFYSLFIFFIGYSLSLLYSYLFIIQDNPPGTKGMYVCFENEYHRLNVHKGRLISTIIAYYLTLTAILSPLILLYYKAFKIKRFSHLELISILSLSLFTIYLAFTMSRRITIGLIFIFLIYLFTIKIVKYIKNLVTFLTLLSIFLLVLYLAYNFFNNTLIMSKFINYTLNDPRFTWWSKGLEIMLKYPIGGGHHEILSHTGSIRLAHNTWIDIGKDFGIIPFISFIILYLILFYNTVNIIFNKNVSILIKHIIILISLSLFFIMLIEPTFTSDKTFFAYSLFYLGILLSFNDKKELLTGMT